MQGLPFPPGSLSRDVLNQPVFLIGGMRALLLQVAEPAVAAGVTGHSDFTHRMLDRLRRTMETMILVGLGDPDVGAAALRDMNRAHHPVRGHLPDGTPYSAQDSDLRLWVLATLVDTVLVAEERFIGEFSEEDRERYYRESLNLARAFGTAPAPPTLEDFRTYMSERVDHLVVSDEARRIARAVLHPRIGWGIPPVVFAPLRAITADLLPPRLRIMYGWDDSKRRERWVRTGARFSRAIIPRLPDRIRTIPLFHPAGVEPDRTLHCRSRRSGQLRTAL